MQKCLFPTINANVDFVYQPNAEASERREACSLHRLRIELIWRYRLNRLRFSLVGWFRSRVIRKLSKTCRLIPSVRKNRHFKHQNAPFGQLCEHIPCISPAMKVSFDTWIADLLIPEVQSGRKR